ncbi:fibronectin type III-like domain-containing protein [Aspergillus ambiguus]|uniref:fibronectin type III-like domain-containing protein n=1 Tax=Aspergillus ambiguus TaxID=176160 RepID=UPI003CCD5F49
MARNITITPLSTETLTALPPPAKTLPGRNPRLWDALYCVSATVKNTGPVEGPVVPQSYLSLAASAGVDMPGTVLRGFEKLVLQPGESKTVDFPLTRRDISHWDIVGQRWVIGRGDIHAYAGFSSRDFWATGSFSPLDQNA